MGFADFMTLFVLMLLLVGAAWAWLVILMGE